MRLRQWLHKRFNIHHWADFTNGGTVDKRRCQICGRVEWFDYMFTFQWFCPDDLKLSGPSR